MPNQNFRVKNGLEVGTGVTISAGIVTATSFVGSGSQLTNVIASSGTATYASVSGVSSSVVGGGISASSLTVTGVSTFDGAVKIRNGYNLNIGDNNDLRIYNDGSNSYIEDSGAGSLNVLGSDIDFKQHSTNETFARFIGGGSVELYYDNSKKIETTSSGVSITGTTSTNQLNVSGFLTATSASFSGNVSIAGTLTYEDVTNIDSVGLITARTGVRIDSGGLIVTAGVSTFAGITTVTGDTLFAKQLNVSGVSTVNTLNVNGESTFGAVTITSGIITATSGITTFYGDISNTVSGRWTLGASGSSHYTFVGIGFTESTNDPTLYLKRGEVYEFINNSGGSHPFQIRVSNGGAAYNNGVTNNGASSGTIRFEVPYNTPDTLYYQCTNHSAMGGEIIILSGVRSIPQNSQTSAYILAVSDIGKHISITTGGVTINADIFSAGDAVSIYNNSGSNQTITQGTSVTLRQAGTANTGNRTLAQYGVCTILCVGSNTFVISGAGLS